MARIKQGILGGFSGKVANVIGSSWKGLAVMKSRPLSVANPKTAGQVAQRSKFSGVVVFAQVILSTVIKPLWDRFASQMSGYNDFVSTNLAFFTGGVLASPSDLVISKGKMASTAISSVTAANGESQATLNWLDDAGQGFKLATDLLYAVIFNTTTGDIVTSSGTIARSALQAVIAIPELTEDDNLECYIAFKRVDGTIVSNTGYFNKTVTA